jgi:hypothetical protein
MPDYISTGSDWIVVNPEVTKAIDCGDVTKDQVIANIEQNLDPTTPMEDDNA